MSEFFRYANESLGKDYSHDYNDFMDLSVEEPNGLEELRNYLATRPENVYKQLERIIPQNLPLAKEIDIDEWKWVAKLVDPVNRDSNKTSGRLPLAHSLKHADFERVQEGIDDNIEANGRLASSLLKSKEALKKERTISILAENGILPKYGFPTDLVELHLPEVQQSIEDNRLSLSRGMRQAIREYAPGSEIVAGKTLWKSVGINKPKGQELQIRRYGKCPDCGTFVWPIENYNDEGECPVCHNKFTLKNKMLVPSYGFVGEKIEKGVGLRKPRSNGYASVHFSQHWPNETISAPVRFPGGTVRKRYAGNGQLCVLNAPREGFQICASCSRSALNGEPIKHAYWCENSELTPKIRTFAALGTSFVSDVLELVFDIDAAPNYVNEDWEAVMWALFTAGAKILEVPETELGGTMYENEAHGISLLIYDDVPGGAGHARQLSDRVPELIEEAYNVVDGHCGCGEETCCYGCIANYYNQTRQAKLSRGAAKRILEALLSNPDIPSTVVKSAEGAERSNLKSSASQASKGIELEVSEDGASFGALSLAEAVKLSVQSGSSEEWKALIQDMIELCSQSRRETPDKDVEVFGGNDASAYATLVWRKSKVMLLDEEATAGFNKEFTQDWRNADGWAIFSVGNCVAANIIERLTEES